jgi:iron complex outermembrane receptor protein
MIPSLLVALLASATPTSTTTASVRAEAASETSSVAAAACTRPFTATLVDLDLEEPLAAHAGTAAWPGHAPAAVRTDADGALTLDAPCEAAIALAIDGFVATTTVVTAATRAAGAVVLRLEAVSETVVVKGEVEPAAHGPLTAGLAGAELDARRGQSLAETLEGVGGVRVQRSGTITKPVIDGFGGSRVVMLVDGVRHHAQLWGLDHAPEIDAFAAERLRVVRGASAVRYGADALGGVILLDRAPFRLRTGVGGEANAVAISNGVQGLLNLRLAGTFGAEPGERPRMGWRVQGSLKKAGALRTPGYWLDNTGVDEANVAAGIGWRGDTWTWSVDVSRFATRIGVFTGQVATSATAFQEAIARGRPLDADLYGFSYDVDRPKQEVWHLSARASAERRVFERARLRLLYAFQHNSRREFDIVRSATPGAQLDLQLGSHTLEVTLDHAFGERVDGVVGVSGLFQRNDHGLRRLIPDYDLFDGGLFAIERYHGDAFTIEAGVRYQRQGADTETPARIAPTKNPPVRDATAFDALMASVGVEAAPHPRLALEAQLATATRLPTMNELFIDGVSQGQGSFETGDRDLRPERTWNVSGAAAWTSSVLDLTVHGYLHYVTNYIYFAPQLDADGRPETKLTIAGAFPAFTYTNVDALQGGGTAEARLHVWPALELRARGAWARGHNLTDDTPLLFVPADRYEARLTFRPLGFEPLERSSAWVEGAVTTEQTRVDLNADFAPPPPAYGLLNLGVATTVRVGAQPLELSLDVRNLLDVRYRDYLSRLRYFADEPGVTATLRLRVPLELGGDGRVDDDAPARRGGPS